MWPASSLDEAHIFASVCHNPQITEIPSGKIENFGCQRELNNALTNQLVGMYVRHVRPTGYVEILSATNSLKPVKSQCERYSRNE
jgi:hypothetical protein